MDTKLLTSCAITCIFPLVSAQQEEAGRGKDREQKSNWVAVSHLLMQLLSPD